MDLAMLSRVSFFLPCSKFVPHAAHHILKHLTLLFIFFHKPIVRTAHPKRNETPQTRSALPVRFPLFSLFEVALLQSRNVFFIYKCKDWQQWYLLAFCPTFYRFLRGNINTFHVFDSTFQFLFHIELLCSPVILLPLLSSMLTRSYL